jgi:hypothetical protein
VKKRRTKLDLTKPIERPRMPLMVLLRAFVLGSVAVTASIYAIWRHYSVPRPSMRMAIPAAEPAASDLVPVPELLEVAPAEPAPAAPRPAPSPPSR